MTKTYIEFVFQNKGNEANADLFISMLADAGFESFMENDDQIQAWIPENDFQEDSYRACFQYEIDISELERKKIPPQNWNSVWEQQFTPIVIRNKLCIRAPFHDQPDSSLMDIVIEPRMSFGTGHHSTTRMMCEVLLDFKPRGHVMDMGSGTGILAIIAMKTGASSAVGIEIEEDAVKNAIENAQKNACQIEFLHGNATLLDSNIFDYFLANINRNIIQKDISSYADSMKMGAILALSGFLLNDIQSIIECCEKEKLSYQATYKDENWAALVFKKSK